MVFVMYFRVASTSGMTVFQEKALLCLPWTCLTLRSRGMVKVSHQRAVIRKERRIPFGVLIPNRSPKSTITRQVTKGMHDPM